MCSTIYVETRDMYIDTLSSLVQFFGDIKKIVFKNRAFPPNAPLPGHMDSCLCNVDIKKTAFKNKLYIGHKPYIESYEFSIGFIVLSSKKEYIMRRSFIHGFLDTSYSFSFKISDFRSIESSIKKRSELI